ncbi:MAG: DUF5678 domain-containing protein [Candidatus Altiarchaeia archaeon]
MDKNYSFVMSAPLKEYTDKWIAVVDGKIVASGLNAKSVYNEAKKKHPAKELLMDKVYGDKCLIV